MWHGFDKKSHAINGFAMRFVDICGTVGLVGHPHAYI